MSDFQPIVRNPHAQTLLGNWLRNVLWTKSQGRDVRIPTRHGDSLHATWVDSPGEQTLIVLHGIGGNRHAGQLLSLASRWTCSGLGPALLVSFRGTCAPPEIARMYHGGASDDAADVYLWARERSRSLFVVGLSLGANIMVKWLGESQLEEENLRLAVSVGNPWDLKACSSLLESTFWGRLYTYGMLRCLRERARRFAERFPGRFCSRQLRSAHTFTLYDSLVTAPLHGFSSLDEYYEKSSSCRHLEQVKTRLLCLDAEDDPFCASTSLPRSAPPNVTLVRTRHGGHLGYIGRPGSVFWLEKFICSCGEANRQS